MRLAAVALLAVAACPAPPAGSVEPVEPPPTPAPPAEPVITWQRIASLDQLPAAAPDAGTWRVHAIDVGTGLSILVQGADFTFLYDAGTNDAREKPARVLDYLAAAIGPCGERIDHVMLSHPHLDHASALDAVLGCYQIGDIWDAGRVNETVFYRELLETIARETGTHYHTAAPPPDAQTQHVKGHDVTVPVDWAMFSEGDEVELGAGAHFTILHAEGKAVKDVNDNSIVVAVELGGARLLLTGDAGSGSRADPSESLGAVEEYLVDHVAAALDADILQVGHHGSKTSSRRAFLDAVTPTLALVSTGPKAYSGTVLPDPEVIDALIAAGATVLRTDEHDAECADGPGGCDSFLVTITPPP